MDDVEDVDPRLKGGSSVEQAYHLKATVREQARELEAVHEDMARKDVELWAAKQAAEEEVVGSKALRKALEGLENDLAQERKLRKLAETKAKDTVLSGSEAFEETRRKLHAAEHARDVALQEARQANKMRDEVASRSAETCAELRAQVKHLEKEHASVNEELAQNKAALTDVSVQRSELAAARQKHIEELKKELEEALSRSRRLAAEKDKVESRLLQVEGAAARAQLFSERLEEAETELDGVRQELATAQKAEREQLTRCGALESSLQSVKNQLASAEARAIQAEAKLGAYANERANRAATHIDLGRTREDLKATKAFIASLEEEKMTLKSKLESTQGRARELETRAEHFQRSLQIVQLQVTQACSASESSFATDEELGSSSLHSTGLENSEVAAEVQPALESVRALGRMHADAKSRLAKALRDAEIAQSSSRDALGQVAGLEQKIRELETEVAQTRDRLGEAKTHARAQNADLQEAHHCVVAMESELHRERDTYQRATHAVHLFELGSLLFVQYALQETILVTS
ncbi:Hypothetical Protein FCC1311_086972 [Hondaea fermentalgiana]|uniref:Uncharacterized protein n=1 Tax=Hondaea fermentalgiana TaxID=2315210 RepID=A0A2R5GNK3_9STRA|nr:Hypothetical Protein FCC1311_086972 [Hondaea fermentalgiana]|eukprot:GBG32472.1 Hypothetical Protein FCC1311_086972 [Hondaea fermentalgiana]